ncbi:Uncharacterised protein [Enterobacter cloacae]|nr:Uncharacterised protein [Enterobacter cloacae]
MLRQCRENLRRRERNVQEKTDSVIHTTFSQLSGERQQMVVVDP